MRTRNFRLLGLAALLAGFAGCESSDDYSGSVNIYGGVGYSSFYDPWYGGYYPGGGGGIVVCPPDRPIRPTPTPHVSGRRR